MRLPTGEKVVQLPSYIFYMYQTLRGGEVRKKRDEVKLLENGCPSLLKESSIKILAHRTPVTDSGKVTKQRFSVTREFLDALNILTVDILAHCLAVAANENRQILTVADVPTFTELMGSELKELQMEARDGRTPDSGTGATTGTD